MSRTDLQQHPSRAPCPDDLERTLLDAISDVLIGAMDTETLRAITDAARLVTELREWHAMGERLALMEAELRTRKHYQA